MSDKISAYLSKIGRKGGLKSRRTLSSKTAKQMVLLREAKKAFKKFHALCFWSYDINYKLTISDLDWVVKELRKKGNREAWFIAEKLCQ